MAHAEEDLVEGIGPQEIDAGPVSVVVVFGAVTTLILIFLTIMFFNYMQAQILETKGFDEPLEKVASVVADQKKQLASYGPGDAQKKTASIPIDVAMAMIVEQRTKDPNPKIVPVAPQTKPGDTKDAGKSASPKTDSKDATKKDAKGNEKH
jgi:hypothetical protein